MDIHFIEADDSAPLERIYIAAGELGNFRGHSNVELHIFRVGATEEELKEIKNLGLVDKSRLPPEMLAGITEESALYCLLEAFTKEEARELAAYLEDRYSDQIKKLTICPVNLPVPLGVGPLAAIPETAKSGFINFDLAGNYPLSFRFKGYYDLGNEVN